MCVRERDREFACVSACIHAEKREKLGPTQSQSGCSPGLSERRRSWERSELNSVKEHEGASYVIS